MTTPKILILDIETRPAKVYTWRAWDVNVCPEQIIEDGGTICVGAKWLGKKEVFLFSDWKHGHKEMLETVYEMLLEADAVVTYNGDKFDLPKLSGEFIINGLPPLPPVTSIDVIKTVKRQGFLMNRLAFIGPLLKIGAKVKHEGFSLWTGVLSGDRKSQEKMEKYCIQDVKLLEHLYNKLRPFIKNHPHLRDRPSHSCGACGSKSVQSRGYRRTRLFRVQRIQCQSCGAWGEGKREKVS